MFQRIESTRNATYQQVKKLSQKKHRTALGLFVLEGEKPILEALRANIRPEVIIVRENSPRLEDVSFLADYTNDVHVVKESLFYQLTQTQHAQDIILVGQQKIHSLSALPATGDSLVVDRLQDPGNMGTIIRSCAATNIDQVIIMPGTVDIYNPKVLRATAGAFFKMNFYLAKDEGQVIYQLEALKKEIVCADGGGDVLLFDMEKHGPQALVIGNENLGPSEAFRAAAHQVVAIPMPGGTESLNASVAASLLVYEVLRKGNN